MSTTQQLPERYRPSTRLVDDKDRLTELYCHRNLSIREIADEYATVSRASVGRAVREYGLTETTNRQHTTDDMDPPDWGKLT